MRTESISPEIREQVYQAVRSRVIAHRKYVEGAACLLWAWFGYLELRKRGIRVLPQAGNAKWPRIDLAKIDEHPEPESTHLAYVWSPETVQSQLAMAAGNLPEVHVWLGLPGEQQIVDFTVAEWPTVCKKHVKCPWVGPQPPKYLWDRPHQFPVGVVYEPVEQACFYLFRVLKALVECGTFPAE